jgi:hypothetical protein
LTSKRRLVGYDPTKISTESGWSPSAAVFRGYGMPTMHASARPPNSAWYLPPADAFPHAQAVFRVIVADIVDAVEARARVEER